MSSSVGPTPGDIDQLKLRQIIADIDQKRADQARKEQEMRYEPRKFFLQFAGVTAAAIGAGAAIGALLTAHYR